MTGVKLLKSAVLGIIIILIVYVIWHYSNKYIDFEDISDSIGDYMPYSDAVTIKIVFDLIVLGIASFCFYMINKKVHKKKALAEIDHRICNIDRSNKKISGKCDSDYMTGSLDQFIKSDKDLINDLIEAMHTNNNQLFIESINGINNNDDMITLDGKLVHNNIRRSDVNKIHFDNNGSITSQDNPGQFLSMFLNSVNMSTLIHNYEYDNNFILNGELKNDSYQKNAHNHIIETEILRYENDPYLLLNNIAQTKLNNYSEVLEIIPSIGKGFDLIGIIVFSGMLNDNYGSYGHYIAYIQRNINGKNIIYKCDDIARYIVESEYNNFEDIIQNIESNGNYINIMLYKSRDKQLKSTMPKQLYHKGNSCYIASALQLLMATDLLDNNENIVQKVPQIEPAVVDNTSIIKNKKIEIRNIIKKLNNTIEKIEKDQRTITRNGAILYGNMRKLIRNYADSANIISTNINDFDSLISKGKQIEITLNKLLLYKEDKNNIDYESNIQSIITNINEINNSPPLTEYTQTPDVEEQIQVPTAIEQTPVVAESIQVPAIIEQTPVVAELIQVPAVINNYRNKDEAIDCLGKEITEYVDKQLDNLQIENINYLVDSKLYLEFLEIKIRNEDIINQYPNDIELRNIYYSCILELNNMSTQQQDAMILIFIKNHSKEILNNVDKYIQKLIDNKYKSLFNKILNDRLKKLIITVNNTYNRLIDNEKQFIEYVQDDDDENNALDDDRFLEMVDNDLKNDTQNYFIQKLNQSDQCQSLKSILSIDDNFIIDDNYITSLNNFLIERIYTIIKLLSKYKTNNYVKKIRRQANIIIKQLQVYINTETKLKLIENNIQYFINMIERPDYENEDDIEDVYNIYTPPKTIKKTKRYGTDSTAFDIYYKELEESTI